MLKYFEDSLDSCHGFIWQSSINTRESSIALGIKVTMLSKTDDIFDEADFVFQWGKIVCDSKHVTKEVTRDHIKVSFQE